MSGKSLLFKNIKAKSRVNTGTMPHNGHFVKPETTAAPKGKGSKVVKDTGYTIDKIEPVVPEIIEETTAIEIIKDTKIDDEIVNDDVNQDTTVNDDDTVIE